MIMADYSRNLAIAQRMHQPQDVTDRVQKSERQEVIVEAHISARAAPVAAQGATVVVVHETGAYARREDGLAVGNVGVVVQNADPKTACLKSSD